MLHQWFAKSTIKFWKLIQKKDYLIAIYGCSLFSQFYSLLEIHFSKYSRKLALNKIPHKMNILKSIKYGETDKQEKIKKHTLFILLE